MTEPQTSVIVIEDDGAMRASLVESIESEADLQVVAECATFAEGAAAIRGVAADVIITDLKLPDGHGSELIRLARQARPGAEIMVISVLGDEQSVVTAISAGATGFLLKDSPQMDLVITLCPTAAEEVRPKWPGKPVVKVKILHPQSI